MTPMRYVRAADAAGALRLKTGGGDDGLFIAGGTNVVDLLTQRAIHPGLLVDVSRVPHRGITPGPGDGLSLGALTTLAAVLRHEGVRRCFPVLVESLLASATPQLRHAATVGGCLLQRTRCSYFRDPTWACNKRQPGAGCDALRGFNRNHALFGASEACIAVHPSDLAVALLALDAAVRVQSPDGETRVVPLGDFHLLPGDTPWRETVLGPHDLVTEVELPEAFAGAASTYEKVDDHHSYGFSLVSVAAAVRFGADGQTVETVRLAAGGVAHQPWRLRGAEAALVGQPLTDAALARAAAAAVAGAQPREHNAVKVELLRRAVVTTLRRLRPTSPAAR